MRAVAISPHDGGMDFRDCTGPDLHHLHEAWVMSIIVAMFWLPDLLLPFLMG
jgi:hypothetical protein